jgi:hypothetical protein
MILASMPSAARFWKVVSRDRFTLPGETSKIRHLALAECPLGKSSPLETIKALE